MFDKAIAVQPSIAKRGEGFVSRIRISAPPLLQRLSHNLESHSIIIS